MFKKIFIVIGLVLVTTLFIGGVTYLSNAYLNNRKSSKVTTVACTSNGVNHVVVIQNNTVTPQTTNSALCDTMTIINKDNQSREIAFGQHDKHVAYDGITEKLVTQNDSFTIELNKTGEYLFHDHDQEDVKGFFIVATQ